METLPQSTDVLIVGAGPTGLAAALSLLHVSPPTRRITIIDALPHGQNESRALVVHARTMEALKEIDASSPLEEIGMSSLRFKVQNSGRKSMFGAEFPLLSQSTKFPFMLLISQVDTEIALTTLLEERGIKIVRPVRVLAMCELPEGEHKFEVKMEGGNSIQCNHILACDGGRSSIRNMCNISFDEAKLASSFLWRTLFSIRKTPTLFTLGDLLLSKQDKEHYELNNDMIINLVTRGFFLWVPTTYHNRKFEGDDNVVYRIAFYISQEEETLVKDRTRNLAFFQQYLDQYFPTKEKSAPRAKQVIWANTFRIRNMVASQSYKVFSNGGAVLLAGDAAHIHSPAGGQGMNLGMCDGIQASRALDSFMASPIGDTKILESYSKRRKDVAEATIQLAARLGWTWTLSHPVASRVRNVILWNIGKLPGSKKGMAWLLSGLRDLKQVDH